MNAMIGKMRTGVDFFDQRYGGVYSNRGFLVCGPSNSGKTVLALQFIATGLQLGQSCLMLSARPADDLALFAQGLGFTGIPGAIADESLCFLEYSNFVPGRENEAEFSLPPDGFDQLQQIIERHGVQRVVLDTVLPWVSVPTPEHLAEHVYSFVRAFERMNTTALFTIPKPISGSAKRLRQQIEDIVPASITLVPPRTESGPRTWIVNKYLGEEEVEIKFDFVIRQNAGLTQADSIRRPAVPPDSRPFVPPDSRPVESGVSVAPRRLNRPASFSDVMLKDRPTGRKEPPNRRPGDDGKNTFSL
jgi:KaiC/GvpD/RAD55 family RecA-like ATPase